MNKKIKCDIYTRVSTTMQVDGYSLDAQKEKLKRYAEFQNMEIVNEYSDEGKSGKSVEGRPEFQRMLDNIENGTDEVQFVLVFKLSRFGRNAADVLNSLQRMQDFGVNLICVEDGIDSSKDSGKLMIYVLSAVTEIEGLEKQHRQLTGAKARLGQQMDSLDIMDKFYEKKYQDMETRLYHLYDEIEGVENSIEEVKNRLLNIRQQKISEENVYQFLLYFDKLYDKFTDLEKKEFLNSFVEQVDIYEQEQPDGRFLKHIKFRFPVYFGDRETQELCWDNESTVETVVLLSQLKQKPDDYINVTIELDDVDITSAETKATYDEIKKYVAEHNAGMKVSNLYISQVKRKCGIEVGKNYNLPKNEDSRQPQCPEDKESAIVEALKHFKMNS